MTNPITFSEAFVDVGDNQFLRHVTHEIMMDNKVIGHFLFTEYDWLRAHEMNTVRSWLDREGTYLGRLSKYLLDSGHKIATLSDVISQGLGAQGQCVIIDDVSISPYYMGLGIEMHVIGRFMKSWEMKFSFAMCPGWDFLCDRMAIQDKDKVEMLNKVGLYPLDDYMMLRYLDDEFLNSFVVSGA
ncbi:hypothetical protein D3C79_33640 [compost metagenome]